MDIGVIFLILIQIILFMSTVFALYKKPFDMGAILVILFLVFYAFPAWDFIFESGFFGREILYYPVSLTNIHQGIYLSFITTLIMITFYLGYKIFGFEKLYIKKRWEYRFNPNRYKLFIGLALSVWILIFLYAFNNYNGSILLFFSPSRKQDIFNSTYLKLLFTFIPQIILILNILKDHTLYNKLRPRVFIPVIFVLLAYLTTGQRREILSFIIFAFMISLHINIKVPLNRINQYKRKKLFNLGILSVTLIPVLWWARTIFSQLQRNSTEIIRPWEVRGFFELLFGSSSTGFKTLLLAMEYREKFGLKWGYSIEFLLNSFIPRSMMLNKPLIIPKLLQNGFELTGNPSMFYVNEMYINFGVLSVFFSFIFGLALSFVYNRNYNSEYFIQKIYAFLIFSNIIMLFKNGFIQFFINLFFSLLIISISHKFVFTKKAKIADGHGGSFNEE